MKKIISIIGAATLVAATAAQFSETGRPSQIFNVPGWGMISGIQGSTNLVSRVESNGVVTLTFSRHDICFAATIPGCPGHTTVWTESFTNRPVADMGVVTDKLFTVEIGDGLMTFSNVVRVVRCKDGDGTCQRVDYLIDGKTNVFHAWSVRVKIKK